MEVFFVIHWVWGFFSLFFHSLTRNNQLLSFTILQHFGNLLLHASLGPRAARQGEGKSGCASPAADPSFPSVHRRCAREQQKGS